ncbi:MAG: DUF5674 family protein [Bacteroidales bacterium]|jgi:hypothetical protein|nr:DUF5674 family protein [Bacteroidales bacterium]
MQIVENKITMKELQQIAENIFGDIIKAVVDVEKNIVAIDAELHADLESILLEKGSLQNNLWGINLYPFEADEDFIEFDSLINIRPSQNNRSRGVENKQLREKIISIIKEKISDVA